MLTRLLISDCKIEDETQPNREATGFTEWKGWLFSKPGYMKDTRREGFAFAFGNTKSHLSILKGFGQVTGNILK